MPRVVIVTRTKNRPLLLRRCVLSVLHQTATDWHHVLVNDGGDCVAVEGLVAQYAGAYHGRVQIIHNDVSVGMQNASNLAIQATDSEYIAIHDDDDSWAPEFLGACMSYLDAQGAGAPEQGVAVQTTWILEEIDSQGSVKEQSRRDYYPFDAVSLFGVAGQNMFPPIAFLYRRAVHEHLGYFNQYFAELGDWDFNLRFLGLHDIGVIRNRLAFYHWRHKSFGSEYGNTVTEGTAVHRASRVRMHNHYLREDLAAGRNGLGFLLNMAAACDGQNNRLDELTAKVTTAESLLWNLTEKANHFERITSDLTRVWRAKVLLSRCGAGLLHHTEHVVRRLCEASHPREIVLPLVLESAVQASKILSCDVFDTVLHRLVRNPTDVFLFMQDAVRKLLGQPKLCFVDARVGAEALSRKPEYGGDSSGETTLDRIYAVLRSTLRCSPEMAQQIRDLEIQTERRLCYQDPETHRLIRQAESAGKTVVFVSDMYLPAIEVGHLLRQAGLGDHQVFVSSERFTSKHHGSLFDTVLQDLKCAPGDVLHIGDNEHSDVAIPSTKGLVVHHWKPTGHQIPLVDQCSSLSSAWDGDLVSSVYAGLARRRRRLHPPNGNEAKSLWDILGYEVMGPLYLAFASWAVSRAAQLGAKKLFFLSRDGFHLVKTHQLLRASSGGGVDAQYLLASRRLWNFPCISSWGETSLAFLTTPNPSMCVADFLRRIGMDPEVHEAQAQCCGFEGLQQVVTTKDGGFVSEGLHRNMRALMSSFRDEILDRAGEERKRLLAYFEDVGLLDEDPIAIVDIGWQASSVKSLYDLLRMSGRTPRVIGLYWGTWRVAQPALDAGCHVESFFVHFDAPKFRADIVAPGVEVLESLLWAPQPTVVGLAKTDGSWAPMFGEPENDEGHHAQLQGATDTAFEFIRDALALLPDPAALPPPYGYLESTLERVLLHPRKEEAALLGGLTLRNSFGGHGPLRRLAKLPTPWRALIGQNALQQAYDQCCWKKGFMAQVPGVYGRHLLA